MLITSGTCTSLDKSRRLDDCLPLCTVSALKEKIRAIFRTVQQLLIHFFQRFSTIFKKNPSVPVIRYLANPCWDVRIETKRSWMRPARPDDLPQIAELWQDRDVMKFNGDGQPKSEEWIQKNLIDVCKFQEQSYIGTYCIYDKKTMVLLAILLSYSLHREK